jgi:4-amino-4-deoxy-L-arabinose transferase-like glycosyltransferase
MHPFIKTTTSKLAFWALALICITSFSMMLYASRTDSAIMDELAHIPAGYGYVHELDYRLNPEHPPLVKALALLPVLFLNPIFPTKSVAWTADINGQWDMGTRFLYESGNDANAIIQTARLFPILLTILTVILIYFLARKLMGDWWALLPATLFALSPTVLGQGHYVTTDVGASFGILLATYYFLNFMEAPTTKRLWLAGIAFGIAQITKFSTPLLLPLFAFVLFVLWIRTVILAWRNTERSRRLKKAAITAWRYARNLVLIVVIGYIFVVYPVYFLFTAHYPIAKQVSDTQALLMSFANGPTPAGQDCHWMRCLATADILAANNPVLRPYAEYLLGLLMVLQRADGGNTIYFLGHVVGGGGWIYFPVLYLLKEPIPTLIIVIFALLLALLWTFQRAKSVRFRILKPVLDYIGVNLGEFTMGSFIVLYWGYSMHSTLNIGLRHIIPTLPFIYILSAGVWKKWATKISLPSMATNDMSPEFMIASLRNIFRSFLGVALKYILLMGLLIWLFLESILAAPYFLSYFNEFVGGTMNGYHYVTDSNYDWGQDLLRLQSWVSQQNKQCPLIETASSCGIDKIAVDYFGGGNPHYYLGKKEVDWSSSKGNPSAQGIHWLAVSVNTLESAIQPLGPGQTRNASDTYSWLVALRPPQPGMGNVPPPDYRIGTSIFVYHL